MPAFTPEQRAKFAESAGVPPEISTDLKSLSPQWDRAVIKRKSSQPLEQTLPLFAELVRSGVGLNRMFSAAFAYDLESRFALLDRSVTLLASGGPLADATKRAATLLPDASLTECPHITASALDAQGQASALAILKAIDST